MEEEEGRRRRAVVIGEWGGVGRSLVERLLKLGAHYLTVVFVGIVHDDSSPTHSLVQLDHPHQHFSSVTVDVRSKSHIIQAIEGSSVVFYLQSTSISADAFYTSYTLIVQGAKNVINACRECKVKRLIYNSSADVVSNWLKDIDNGDEAFPYSTNSDMLSDLKAQAEALVLFANNIDGLLTCALRPCNVFGPEDTKIIPFLVKGAKFGFTKFILGSGQNKIDFTYVENVSHGLMCADEALGSQMVSVAGKAFFITNFEPAMFWDFATCILEGLGYQRPTIRLPDMFTRNILLLIKWINGKLDSSSKLNHFTAVDKFFQLALCTRTFNCSAAHKQIGYSPVVSLEEGIALTVESFSSLRRDKIYLECGDFKPSSVEQLLGRGKAADILLWRDEKKTFTCFLVLVMLCYWVFTSEGTFISFSAKLLLLVTVMLLGYSVLPCTMCGMTLQKIPLYCFDVSKEDMIALVSTIAYLWNGVVSVARKLAQGDDWNIFIKVVFSLYVLDYVLSRYLMTVIGGGIVLAFTLFFIYDQYEEEINEIGIFLFETTKKVVGLLKNNVLICLPSFLYDSESVIRDKKQKMEKD